MFNLRYLAFGLSGGYFKDKSTGRDVEYYKLHVLKSVEQKNDPDRVVIGQACEKLSMTKKAFFSAPDRAEDYNGGLLLDCTFDENGTIVSVDLCDDD